MSKGSRVKATREEQEKQCFARNMDALFGLGPVSVVLSQLEGELHVILVVGPHRAQLGVFEGDQLGDVLQAVVMARASGALPDEPASGAGGGSGVV